ncbi:MAG TPA: T9SS type A sorting domain-containing protein [Saprospiraceae bacterium]|nr:T9SS type A sorting domain-containing protein [Saprospiraceae bacterium]
MRYTLSVFLVCAWAVMPAQYMNWSRLAEDTIYYAREYFPEEIFNYAPGPSQVWDFRMLRAPYAIKRSILATGERDKVNMAQLVNGSQVDAILQLNGPSAQIVQIIEDNPVCPSGRLSFQMTPAYKPFFRGVLGEHTSYKGKLVAVFPWPKHLECGWVPPLIPDTCRITYTINEDIDVDGQGMLYLPTEISSANRQHIVRKTAIRIETHTSLLWRDVTSLVPGIRLIRNEEFFRFVDDNTGLMLAEIEMKEDDQPFKVEFKTHPMATRIVTEEPSRPDVFAFPNPSFDIVRFQLSDLANGKYKITILNILGTPVKEMEIYVDDRRKTITMDLSDLQRGTYLYRLQDGGGRTIKTKRVVLIQA